MKKLLRDTMIPLAAAVLLLPLPSRAADSVTYTATYDFSLLTVGTDTLGGVPYTTVSYDGLYNFGAPGTPSLPVDHIRFSVPYNATNFRVTAMYDRFRTMEVEHTVYPFQEHFSPLSVTLPDSTIYCPGACYPLQNVWVEGESMLAGENHIVTVAVMPVSYSLGAAGTSGPGVLRKSPSIRLTLSYDRSDTLNLFPVTRLDTALRDKGFDYARSMVVNPGDVRANSYSLSGGSQVRGGYPPEPNVVNDPLTYIIVATPESLRPMRRLAALKRQKGINVKIVTVTQAVTDSLAGNGDLLMIGDQPYLLYTDDAGKLKQYLKMNYNYNGTEYVLLAGTSVPHRNRSFWDTDFYYSELNDNWAYAMYIDNVGELYVGRLLGTTKDQFDNYTDKLLRYELNPGNGDVSYLKRAIATEGLDYYGGSGIETLSSSFTTVTLFQEDYDESGPYYSPEFTGGDVLDEANTNRYGLMTSFNDGFPTGIRLYDGHDDVPSHYLWAIDSVKVAPDVNDSETGNGLNRLDNKSYPMVYLSYQGQTIPFHSVTGYGSCLNYGESFTTGKDYGGPAYLGLTDGVYDDLQCSFFANNYLDGLLDDHPVLGENLVHTKSSLQSRNYEDINLASNLIGDPALELWTDLPQTYSGITVSRTDNSVSVAGLPTGTTKVAYHSNDGTTGLQSCSSSSVTLSGVSPNSTVMLYRHDYIPYIAPLVLQNTDLENPQYVFAGKVRAGYNVDSGRTHGDVTVKSGADYEIEAAGEVFLGGGFSVERGASFSVVPSTYK